MRIRDLRSHCGTVVVLQQCLMRVLAIMVDITVVVALLVESIRVARAIASRALWLMIQSDWLSAQHDDVRHCGQTCQDILSHVASSVDLQHLVVNPRTHLRIGFLAHVAVAILGVNCSWRRLAIAAARVHDDTK